MRKYDEKTITRAKELFSKGISFREICKKTGIKSTSTVMYHCDPNYRAAMKEHGAEWRAKHKEQWRKICRKAAKKNRDKE